MKKVMIAIALICIVAIGSLVCYHFVGWFRGDLLGYIQENFRTNGESIVSGEYLETGEDEQGGYVMYQVTTESGSVHYVRVNVVFHRYLTKVGPDYRIKGIREVPERSISGLWPAYTMETAIECADRIVYGKVVSKSDTKIQEAAELSDGSKVLEYYQSVAIEVLDCIKGDPAATEIEYIEMGGETGKEVVRYEDEPELIIGENVLVFLNENGAPLSPVTVIRVSDTGKITVADEMLPEDVDEVEPEKQEWTIEEYCERLREEME